MSENIKFLRKIIHFYIFYIRLDILSNYVYYYININTNNLNKSVVYRLNENCKTYSIIYEKNWYDYSIFLIL